MIVSPNGCNCNSPDDDAAAGGPAVVWYSDVVTATASDELGRSMARPAWLRPVTPQPAQFITPQYSGATVSATEFPRPHKIRVDGLLTRLQNHLRENMVLLT